ncbi:unnamed protein product [Heterobilharzia americana]|nr:unnamed protein product [Heterobilharzia americana]
MIRDIMCNPTSIIEYSQHKLVYHIEVLKNQLTRYVILMELRMILKLSIAEHILFLLCNDCILHIVEECLLVR